MALKEEEEGKPLYMLVIIYDICRRQSITIQQFQQNKDNNNKNWLIEFFTVIAL